MDKDKDKRIETDNSSSLDISRKINISEHLLGINANYMFVLKKTEKIATAVYLITNLFSSDEPMKWTLRKKVNDMLSFIAGYTNSLSSGHKDFSDKAKNKILELISLTKVASDSGLVSVMNYSILEHEFLNLIKIIDSQNTSISDNTAGSISKSFFFVPEPDPQIEIQTVNKERKYELPSIPQKTQSNSIKDIINIKDKIISKKTNRQDSIIALLKKKSDLNIKDIAIFIKGCSEKTVQRELISLIASGVIKKTGERRWSKYSLNQ
jgi:hypothetical protein